MATDISAKRLELLLTTVPQVSRIAILWDSSNPGMALRVRETKMAADQSKIVLHTVGPRNLAELEANLAELTKQRPEALIVTAAPETVAAAAGDVIDTVGGVFSTLLTVTVTAADVV